MVTYRARRALLLFASGVVAAQDAAAPAAGDVFGTGWQWELAPTKLRDGFDPRGQDKPKVWTQHGQSAFVPSGLVSLVQTAAGHPVFTHVRTKDLDARGSAAPDHRAILFTADGKPIFASMSMGMGRSGLWETRYVFPVPNDPAAISSFALALLDLDGKRARAAAGQARAKELGASVLPLPLLDQPLAFELPTLAGEVFRAKEHLGKVVVIDSWATW